MVWCMFSSKDINNGSDNIILDKLLVMIISIDFLVNMWNYYFLLMMVYTQDPERTSMHCLLFDLIY